MRGAGLSSSFAILGRVLPSLIARSSSVAHSFWIAPPPLLPRSFINASPRIYCAPSKALTR
jgi:hypothetical protein